MSSSQVDQVKQWQILYPAYIDSKKKISEGRRIPVSKCAERPTAQEMYDICKYLGLQCELEVPHKPYSTKS